MRERVIKSAEDFGALVDSFITHSEQDNIIPDDYQFLSYIEKETGKRLAYRTLTDYKNENGKYNDYAEHYERLIIYREHFYSKLAFDNPRLTSFGIFALKQHNNGSWTDKQEINIPEIVISMNGKETSIIGQ